MKNIVNNININRKLFTVLLILILFIIIFAWQDVSAQAHNSDNEEIMRNTTTLEDNFVDNKVGIILNRSENFNNKVYQISSFPEIDAIHVEETTQRTTDIVRTQIKAEESGALDKMSDLLNNENSRFFQPLSVQQQFSQYSDIIPFVESNRLFDLDSYRRILLL